ncbi:hypothetical protein L873DRAFT_1795255 [Choiromyces venosus 120613-1]|uniref:Tc1-like transposase DDE domain-containing protein n=1 Tax=Choiromyces venosus 120613-1 TaxID=1336337 RepID=A0A3N4JAJ9_9PEZI|nr:hypothetical protein L873DRAFT_1795255 [Choiromyces venosus 120613-1]
MWRRRAMWSDEVTVERGGEKRRKWIFRYPKEKRNKDCIESSTRVEERKVSQMMTGFFHGQRHGLFLLVFPDLSSAASRVTGKSILDVYDHDDFVKIWENIKRELGEEEVFLIIDNTKTYLPFMRWLKKHGITLLELLPIHPISIQLRISGL